MSDETITAILEGRYADPDGGPPLAVRTKSVMIADSLGGIETDLVMALDFGRTLAVVSDARTREALGERVERALSSAVAVISVVLPRRPHADIETVARLRQATVGADALIAVGSGTINDLCKYAAAEDKKPYAVFGTAPSMNGYASVNAAITVNGLKKTLPAVAPSGVFLDLGVLAAAPRRLILSGLGDSLCRSTAQTDWLLAHLLFDRPYREAPFALLAEDEDALFGEPEALLAGDLEAMGRLARTLALSGFGMTICGGSYPASQGEHLISHYMEMLAPKDWPEAYHGEQIGVTTLTMARLQERMLADDRPRVAPTTVTEADVKARFGPGLGGACWQEFVRKRLDAAAAAALNQRLAETWDDIRERLFAVRRPSSALHETLRRVGAPTVVEDLGWSRDFYNHAVRHAREIRDRYTFLDLAGDSGAFDRAGDLIF